MCFVGGDALRVLQGAVGEGVVLVCDACIANRAPVIEPFAIYRTYSGQTVAISVAAVDPDGDDLTYSAANLPEGCSIGVVSGGLSWQPSAEQLGPRYIQVTATDDDDPDRAMRALSFSGRSHRSGLPRHP